MMAQFTFGDVADRLIRSLMRHRDRYLRAWIAETGALPSECMLEERLVVDADVATARTVVVRRQADAATATIADLRDRLALLAPFVCEGCGVATRNDDSESGSGLCEDCDFLVWAPHERDMAIGDTSWYYAVACVSAGLRALAGRRLVP